MKNTKNIICEKIVRKVGYVLQHMPKFIWDFCTIQFVKSFGIKYTFKSLSEKSVMHVEKLQ